MKNYKNLIFDIDGTLVDPKDAILTELVATLEEFGISVSDPNELTYAIGPPLRVTMKELFKESDDARLEKMLIEYQARFATHGLKRLTLYPAVHETLASFRDEGYELFVATSRPDFLTTQVLNATGITEYFSGIHSPTPEGIHDDKAHLLRHLLREEGLRAEESVMIGDRNVDMVGARLNRLHSIGILHGYGSREELEAAGADVILNDLVALREYFSDR